MKPLGRPTSPVMIQSKSGHTEVYMLPQAAERLGVTPDELRSYLNRKPKNYEYALNGEVVEVTRIKGAAPPVTVTRRKQVGPDAWVFDIVRDGEASVVTGLKTLSDLLQVKEGTVRLYLSQGSGASVERYINHKLTRITRRPLPMHEARIGGGDLNTPTIELTPTKPSIKERLAALPKGANKLKAAYDLD